MSGTVRVGILSTSWFLCVLPFSLYVNCNKCIKKRTIHLSLTYGVVNIKSIQLLQSMQLTSYSWFQFTCSFLHRFYITWEILESFLLPPVPDLVSHRSALVWQETSDPLYCLTRTSSECLFPWDDTNIKFHSWMQTKNIRIIFFNSIPSAQCLLFPQVHKSQSLWEFQQYSGRYGSSVLQGNIQWPLFIKVTYDFKRVYTNSNKQFS